MGQGTKTAEETCMSWIGKTVGITAGFCMGGPLGAILGGVLGSRYDQYKQYLRIEAIENDSSLDTNLILYKSIYLIMGLIAKADGRVSEQEIMAAEYTIHQMQLSEEQRIQAISWFNQGKNADFDFNELMSLLFKVSRKDKNLIKDFLMLQIANAFIDNRCDVRKRHLLETISQKIGVSKLEFNWLYARIVLLNGLQREENNRDSKQKTRESDFTEIELRNAYGLLKIQESDTNEEITMKYRRLINQNHPDKLVSRGATAVDLASAAARTHEIRAAYECIRRTRGF